MIRGAKNFYVILEPEAHGRIKEKQLNGGQRGR
jgi:hypothetical protein